MRVSSLALEQTGLTEQELCSKAANAQKGYDGSFLIGNNLLAICRQKVADEIIFLGKIGAEDEKF